MATPKKKLKADTATLPFMSGRSYLFLKEMEPLGYSVEALLDFGVSNKLTLSFVMASRSIVSGHYHDGDGETECIEHDGAFNGLAPVLQEYAWKILADGKATIEYTYQSETEFARIECSDAAPLPVVSRDQVVITVRDWDRFNQGLPAVPSAPQVEAKPKRSEILTIGALAHIYITNKATTHVGYLTSEGKIIVSNVGHEVVKLLSPTTETHHPGVGNSNIHSLINAGLKAVTEIIKANKALSDKKKSDK